MGKKQKNIQKQNGTKIFQKNDEETDNKEEKIVQNDKIKTLSKKQKRKLKKLSQKHNKAQQLDEDNQQKTIVDVENGQQEEQIEEEIKGSDESLIEIESSQEIEDNFGNDVEFDPKGKQGFQSLVNQTNSESHNNIKSISIKSALDPSNQTIFYLFHLKKDTLYKATVPTHENINLTHLNQPVKLSIIDENLLKQGSRESSSLFWENGKIQVIQIQFLRSAVFKIVPNQNKTKPQASNAKDRKKNNQVNTQQMIKNNINQFIKPLTQTDLIQIIDFLHDFEWKQDSLVICRENLIFNETKAPFEKIDPQILSSNASLMILGKKNTGKSTLAQYLRNINPTQVCILDCDIGRSLTVSGCVSLITETENVNLWVGEFTPFNCIINYVNAIEALYQLYREKYFSKKLIINTMGYLNGLGEMIIYEIYSLVNPSQIIVLNSGSQNQQGSDNLSSILYHIKSGSYLNKLLTILGNNQRGVRRFNEKKLNLNIQYLTNIHAQGKGIPIRFESLLQHKQSFKNVLQLIQAVKRKQMQKLQILNLYQQDKLGNVIQLNRFQKNHSDMRIVLIGKWIEFPQIFEVQNRQQKTKLFRVFGIGFGFEGNVYYSPKQIQSVISPSIELKQQVNNIVGVLSEGIDFEKNFYLINQISLIEHQLNYGSVPYIMPIIKGMGSKGTRNNPSKNL